MTRPISKLALLSALGVVVTCLTGALLVAFHAPLQTTVHAKWVEGEKLASQSIYHFATEDCRCSEQLLAHLAARPPAPGASETVVYIGKRNPIHQQLESAGYQLRFESSPEATGVAAAPWLLVRDSSGRKLCMSSSAITNLANAAFLGF
ncbi:MAG: hypothetical protein FJW36_25425 [Acidobacteria bacterium]|nr:hypothetical protein [Acidobacteriota bacterium]